MRIDAGIYSIGIRYNEPHWLVFSKEEEKKPAVAPKVQSHEEQNFTEIEEQRLADLEEQRLAEEKIKQQRLTEWMNKARQANSRHYWRTPKDDSAEYYVDKILAVAPDDLDAQALLQEAVNQYARLARKKWQQNPSQRKDYQQYLDHAQALLDKYSFITPRDTITTLTEELTTKPVIPNLAKQGRYQKLSATGQPLPKEATSWACVKDQRTGLIWEVKNTDPNSVQYQDKTFKWGGKTALPSTGGFRSADWNSFLDYARNNKLCGFSDWKVPSRQELRTLVDYSKVDPAINTAYFPHTASAWFWSSSPDADYADDAWIMNFKYGSAGSSNRTNDYRVRLVRAGQSTTPP